MLHIQHPVRNALLFLSVALAASPAPGDPPPHSDRQERAPEYKVAYWFRRSDPLNTFRHRVYDLRKGQYTRAVDDWLRTIRSEYPDYEAYIKDLHLDSRGGQDEEKQLASAIIRENLARGGPNRGFGLRDAYGIYGGANLDDLLNPRVVETRPQPVHPSETSQYYRGYGFVVTPGAPRPPLFLQNPWPTSTPFPYPYARPHP